MLPQRRRFSALPMPCLPTAKLFRFGVAAVVFGCTSTEPRQPAGLNGNFGSTSSSGWLGVTLRESAGLVTGTGWSAGGKLRFGGTITGTYQAPAVQFDLVTRQGGETWRFSGTFERDTLRGDFAQIPFQGALVELARTDTVPTGEYTLHLTGAITADLVGAPAFFSVPSSNGFALSFESAGPPLYQVTIFWEGGNRPQAGGYPLSFGPGASPLAGVYRYEAPGFVHLPPISGTLTLDVSTRRAMIGRFELVVTDPATGGIVTARASFSAGCTGNAC